VKLPRQRAGRVVEGSFPLINVVPSLLSYLGYPRDRFDMRGDAVNLAEVLRCSDKPIYLAAESAAQGVIDGQRAYVSNEDKTAWEYYDLATDPLEQHNLLARQPAPAEVKTLKALFEKWDKGNTLREVQFYGTKADHRRLQTLKPDSPAQRATIERLKALGYNVGAH